jgi:hypothetical protein
MESDNVPPQNIEQDSKLAKATEYQTILPKGLTLLQNSPKGAYDRGVLLLRAPIMPGSHTASQTACHL